MKNIRNLLLTAGILTSATTCVVRAHIGYSGRDFGSFTGLSYESVTIGNQAITSNYGWADAADGILGDSHKGRAFRLHLDNEAVVSIRFEANPTATSTSVGGLTPAFSIYSGLAAIAPFATSQTSLPSSADHDFSDASVAWRTAWVQQNLSPTLDASATDGSWNALGNWKIGGDGDLPGDFTQLSSFTFDGFASTTDKGGFATYTGVLAAGDYTLFVGGNDISNKGTADAALAYGVSGTVSVSVVPEPGTYALAMIGLAFLALTPRGRK